MLKNRIFRIKRNFYKSVDRFAYRCDLKRRASVANRRSSKLEQSPLTKEEKEAVRQIWGDYSGKYTAFGFYKSFCGRFDAEYVPDDYYDFAEHVLNLRWSAYFLQHKCNLKYFIPSENRAKVIVQKIDGHYVDENNHELSEKEAINILLQTPEFIAKVARGTGGGKGVRKVVWNQVANQEALIKELTTPIDMEFEAVIHQNPCMAQFNPDSVNTLRLVTLNINGTCSVLSTFIRMGAIGSFVDNLSGGNGILVGVKQDGSLHDFGITKKYQKRAESFTGIKFSETKIPNFESIKNTIIGFHKTIPYANLIGWDITIDDKGHVVVIELNLDSALIEAHQIFNGPVFGNRLKEVMEYINKRKSLLKHQMMTY